jgi:FkbM family methyltransferase
VTKLSFAEAFDQGLISLEGEDGWERRYHSTLGHDTFYCTAPGTKLKVRTTGRIKGLWLLKHGWSGKVRLREGGNTTDLDLRDEVQDLAFIRPLAPQSELELEVLAADDLDPSRNEVWFLGVVLDTVSPMSRGAYVVNDNVRLLYGDWGQFAVLTTDTDIPRAILREGSWAPHDIELFQRHIAEGDTVLDVGANFGHHSVVFSKLVGDAGQVVAIEAQRVMHDLLHANAALNGRRNIQPVLCAAGAAPGEAFLYPISYASETNFGSLGIAAKDLTGGERVVVRTVDSIIVEYLPESRVSFVKIDVQAYELFVLQGMSQTLAQHRPVIFAEIAPSWMLRAGYSFREIYKLLFAANYDVMTLRDLPLGDDGVPEVENDCPLEWDVLATPRQVAAV